MQTRSNRAVLVAVLRRCRDLELLLTRRWYRIPVTNAPARAYAYLAFYQPASAFGVRGQCIRYYARVRSHARVQRIQLLPDEPEHPGAREWYDCVRVDTVRQLQHPVRNITPRRVTFGFTTLHRLRTAQDFLQLYNVAPIEQLVEDGLRRAGIVAIPQQTITEGARRYRLDFAVPCRSGAVAIECDNIASHRSPAQRARDARKDTFLRARGWMIVRLPEDRILQDLPSCIARIRSAMRQCGGACVSSTRQ
ncbi:MAG: DUF559 domain-containing protein [bacterium]|nr:DUF559 domain-containing protein [bacterium]